MALAIKIESFIDVDEYKEEVQRLIDWVKSSATMPGVDRIYLPVEIEQDRMAQRTADRISIPDAPWERITATANELNVSIPEVS